MGNIPSFRKKKKFDIKMTLCFILLPSLAFIVNLSIKEEINKSNQAIKSFAFDAMGYEPADVFKKEFDTYKQEIERLKIENEKLLKESKVSRGSIERPSPPPDSPAREEFKPSKVIRAIENNLQGAFKSKAPFIYQKSKEYNVNPMLVAAIARHETGNGSSKAIVELNNPGGLMGNNGLIRFNSIESGIESMVKNLKVLYIDMGLTSIEEIQKKYCPIGASNDPTGINKYWLPAVTSNYLKILEEAK